MRIGTLIAMVMPLLTAAQVTVDKPVQFTGSADQRGALDVAPATTGTSAITVEASLTSAAHWSQASFLDTTFTLSQPVAVTEYRNGMLLRFLVPIDVHGSLWLRCGALPKLELVRPDGLQPANGQLLAGRVAEVMLFNDQWVLLNAPERGCPAGFIPVNERLCVERNDTPALRIYAAQDRCAALGGKLCRWDEAYLACATVGPAMLGLFNGWEWVDDTANHAHTAGQVGLTSCQSQRTITILTTVSAQGRCCFHPR